MRSVEEMHDGYSTDPVVAGNFFSVAMGLDATMKGMGRMRMDEIAVYEVKDGKIVKEQFFFQRSKRCLYQRCLVSLQLTRHFCLVSRKTFTSGCFPCNYSHPFFFYCSLFKYGSIFE